MSPGEIAALLAARMDLTIAPSLASALSLYLDLLLRWNARTNLTAIRNPEEIVLRHFGESLACAAALPSGIGTLLDYGSGAGFPGAICALARPELRVTLAESQGKKAAFLAELARTLDLPVTIHAGRVETLPRASRFDAVTLRAVDRMQEACLEARSRVRIGGWLAILTTAAALNTLAAQVPGVAWRTPLPLPGGRHGVLALGQAIAA